MIIATFVILGKYCLKTLTLFFKELKIWFRLIHETFLKHLWISYMIIINFPMYIQL